MLEDHGAGDQPAQLGELVQDDDDGHPSVVQARERPGEGLLAGMVDAGHRLVEDEQLRLAHQGAGDEHALLLAAGEHGHGALLVLGHVDLGECLRGPLPPVPWPQEPGSAEQPGRDDLPGARRHAAAVRNALGHVAQPVPGRGPAEGRTEQLDRACGRAQNVHQGAYEGRLSGPVRAEQGDGLSAGDVEVHPVHDARAAERDVQAARAHDDVGRCEGGHGPIMRLLENRSQIAAPCPAAGGSGFSCAGRSQ